MGIWRLLVRLPLEMGSVLGEGTAAAPDSALAASLSEVLIGLYIGGMNILATLCKAGISLGGYLFPAAATRSS